VNKRFRNAFLQYVGTVACLAVVNFALWPFHAETRPLTAAACLSIVLMGVALYWGTGPALFGSIISALYINFYYIPPTHSFSFQIAQDDDLVALIAFLVMSIVVGQLSARAQRRADENQKLYQQLRVAFEQASQLEGLKRSERFKSVLLDTVTHDLRTPLTSIKAAAASLIELRLISTGHNGKEQPEDKLLHIITKQADRLNQFIEEMIEFAKLESHSEHRSEDMQPVEEIITNSLARAEEALAGRNIMVNYDEQTAGMLAPKPTSQVLYLLLENAAKHSPKNCAVQVLAFQEGTDLIIAVEDEGPGITAELREKIFEKFFHLKNVDEGSIEGLGLGLAIAKGITETQGGKIWVEESTGPTGARFLFSVPMGHSEEVIATRASM
jgi:two-component system sensor histidine kinase KdpD